MQVNFTLSHLACSTAGVAGQGAQGALRSLVRGLQSRVALVVLGCVVRCRTYLVSQYELVDAGPVAPRLGCASKATALRGISVPACLTGKNS